MGRVTLIDPSTRAAHVFDDQRDAPELAEALARGWEEETDRGRASRTIGARVDEDHSGLVHALGAAPLAAARGVSGGLSDVALRAIGGEDAAYEAARLREANPNVSTAFEVGGSFVGPGAALGARLAKIGAGAGAAKRIGTAAAGGFVEGGLIEAGGGLSDLALADDPLSIERLASSLPGRFLYGGATGGVATGVIGGLEATLVAGRRRLTRAGDELAATGGITEDLVALDAKGLREAREAELAAIEGGRVPQRQAFADEFGLAREKAKVDRPWDAVATGSKEAKIAAQKAARKAAKLADAAEAAGDANAAALREAADQAAVDATEQAALAAAKAPRWMREHGARALKADRQFDAILNDPKALSGAAGDRAFHSATAGAASALRKQEAALESILARADELKAIHATDRTGRRAAALDSIPSWLERNRAMQRQIAELTSTPASERLTAIADATGALGSASKRTLGEQMAGGAAYGLAADVVRSVPLVGPFLAPLVGARVADAVSGKLGGQLAAATKAAKERAVKAVDAFLTVTKGAKRLAPKVAPVLSSRALEAVRFGAEVPTERRDSRRRPTVEELYDARSAELGAAVTAGPDGRPKVRPGVRQQIGERLAPLAAVAPHVADRLQTRAVRRLEFLAAKMPRATQLGMTRIRPDEFAIRAWAHYVAAAEDPGGIEERLADGSVTSEDAEVMRELYPERMAEIIRQVMTRLGELRGTLPYERQLALSIFTGVPVHGSMVPRILGALQASFIEEPGTAGGTQAPQPKPAFGSVERPEPTRAQRRAG